MVNEHRLPFAWTMFDPLIISLRTSNRFNGLTDRVTARPARISLCRAMLLAKTDCGKIKTVAQTKQTLFRIEFPSTSSDRLAIRPVCFAKVCQLIFKMTVSNRTDSQRADNCKNLYGTKRKRSKVAQLAEHY
ncbi:uncharacterized protein LOC122567538 isoform X1 [Bombus pyrosoma]|uniref:uncharacterized protein LOC122567538 isoform X1 n=1 Tax=Bombus pyrosoma TaxID=396416 RepID=UPI001CB97440|nr:uncharacterized protein LOC122567538 isoform X1 [Bombus pyrosoma]